MESKEPQIPAELPKTLTLTDISRQIEAMHANLSKQLDIGMQLLRSELVLYTMQAKRQNKMATTDKKMLS